MLALPFMGRDEVLAPNTPIPDLTNISRVEKQEILQTGFRKKNPTEA